ncbi:hypothetical protein MINTM011_26510 [Mycobacterium paraintracellulare]|nr:hypothetical protein MINTM011_26510 [Mycobacterium paraintracellulare]
MSGHLVAGVVGCDFVTGRTGSGAIFTIGGGAGGAAEVVGALVIGGADGAGLCAEWQPHVIAASRPMDPSQATALRTRTRRGLIEAHSTHVSGESSELLHRSFFGAVVGGAAEGGDMPSFTDTTNIE